MAFVKFFLVLSLLSLQCAMDVSGQGLHCYDCRKGAPADCGTGTKGLKPCVGVYTQPDPDSTAAPTGVHVTCAKHTDGGSIVRKCAQLSKEEYMINICPALKNCEACDVDLGADKGCNGGGGSTVAGTGSGGNQLLPGRFTLGLIGLIISICMMGLGWTPPVDIFSQQQ